ncbi:MAG TPA: MBL fold metallo-hydrolase [Dehalococcoidia bacterium]|nr:MBL fold metallo-hydrolase [Dehalococcoidia bacterium]
MKNRNTHRATIVIVVAMFVVSAVTTAAQSGGDAIPTSRGDVVILPLDHATFIMGWDGKTIYVDPVGGTGRFADLPTPDLILVTDIHGDHMNAETLTAISTAQTTIVAPAAVAEQLPASLMGRTVSLANGQTGMFSEIGVEAIPAYNLTEDRLRFHDKGRGNGYVVTVGGTRIYIAGDTEDVPEMRALRNIDVAFVPMNLPYTMTEEQAASGVNAFNPGIVYPYHFQGSDLEKFKMLVEADGDTEVRVRDWYALR